MPPTPEDLRFERELQRFREATMGLFDCGQRDCAPRLPIQIARGERPPAFLPACEPVGGDVAPSAADRHPFESAR